MFRSASPAENLYKIGICCQNVKSGALQHKHPRFLVSLGKQGVSTAQGCPPTPDGARLNSLGGQNSLPHLVCLAHGMEFEIPALSMEMGSGNSWHTHPLLCSHWGW